MSSLSRLAASPFDFALAPTLLQREPARRVKLNYAREILFQVQVHLKQCHPVVYLKQTAVFKKKLNIKQGFFCWTDVMFIGYGLLIKIGTEQKWSIESELRTLMTSECIKLAHSKSKPLPVIIDRKLHT